VSMAQSQIGTRLRLRLLLSDVCCRFACPLLTSASIRGADLYCLVNTNNKRRNDSHIESLYNLCSNIIMYRTCTLFVSYNFIRSLIPCIVNRATMGVHSILTGGSRVLPGKSWGQWRSNRLCRLCSTQGPPAFSGPQPPGYIYGTDVCRCHEHHDYSCCTISLLQSPEYIEVQHFEGQNRIFFWGSRPQTHWRGGYPLPRPHSRWRLRCLDHSSAFGTRSTAPSPFLRSLRL